MQLNLGCWEFAAPGWVNVDVTDQPGVDVIADVTALPFPDASAHLVYAGHILEHLTYEDQLPRALREIRRVLSPDGGLMVVGPDLDRARQRFPAEVSAIWPGAGADGPMGHKWASTVPDTTRALRRASFHVEEMPVASIPRIWPIVSRVGWQFALRCWHEPLGPYRPEDDAA
jgi:predicted SAM-dependent methyltransferase